MSLPRSSSSGPRARTMSPRCQESLGLGSLGCAAGVSISRAGRTRLAFQDADREHRGEAMLSACAYSPAGPPQMRARDVSGEGTVDKASLHPGCSLTSRGRWRQARRVLPAVRQARLDATPNVGMVVGVTVGGVASTAPRSSKCDRPYASSARTETFLGGRLRRPPNSGPLRGRGRDRPKIGRPDSEESHARKRRLMTGPQACSYCRLPLGRRSRKVLDRTLVRRSPLRACPDLLNRLTRLYA